MRLLVTSDTHLSNAASLPDGLLGAADHADHILHAGDLSSLEVLRVLERFAPVTAVQGNVELADVSAALPVTTTVAVGGVVFGLVHDSGTTSGRHERLSSMFPTAGVIVYGHSHMPEATRLDDGTWILNPGSPTQRRRAPWHSFAWVELADGQVRSCELVQLD